MEQWKPITGFDGYQVSNYGNIKSKKEGKLMALSVKGKYRVYLGVLMWVGKKVFCRYVHRIVAIEFCDNPNNYPEVNHIDGVKLNNHAVNLEWVTRSQNMEHAKKLPTHQVGEMKYASKLTSDQVDEIRKRKKDNPLITVISLAREFGIHPSQMSRVISGVYWKHLKI